jgi:prepilin-type N-terminal cleavage/methylation domain-containing protein
MTRIPRKHNGVRGFTLLEVVVAVAITGIISVSLLAAMPKWQNAYYDNTAFAYNSDRTRDVFTKMCDEIRQTGLHCPDWQITSASIRFDKCAGAYLTTKLWGSSVTYSYSATNHTITRTSGGVSTVVCANVQSAFFSVTGEQVTVTLVVQTQSRQGRAITTRLSSVVSLRN